MSDSGDTQMARGAVHASTAGDKTEENQKDNRASQSRREKRKLVRSERSIDLDDGELVLGAEARNVSFKQRAPAAPSKLASEKQSPTASNPPDDSARLAWMRKQLKEYHQRDSFHSFDSTRSFSSLAELFQERLGDPEGTLTELGFAPVDRDKLIYKVPTRFLRQPSTARGVSVEEFVSQHSVPCGTSSQEGSPFTNPSVYSESSGEASPNTSQTYGASSKLVNATRNIILLQRFGRGLQQGARPHVVVTAEGITHESILTPTNTNFIAQQGFFEANQQLKRRQTIADGQLDKQPPAEEKQVKLKHKGQSLGEFKSNEENDEVSLAVAGKASLKIETDQGSEKQSMDINKNITGVSYQQDTILKSENLHVDNSTSVLQTMSVNISNSRPLKSSLKQGSKTNEQTEDCLDDVFETKDSHVPSKAPESKENVSDQSAQFQQLLDFGDKERGHMDVPQSPKKPRLSNDDDFEKSPFSPVVKARRSSSSSRKSLSLAPVSPAESFEDVSRVKSQFRSSRRSHGSKTPPAYQYRGSYQNLADLSPLELYGGSSYGYLERLRLLKEKHAVETIYHTGSVVNEIEERRAAGVLPHKRSKSMESLHTTSKFSVYDIPLDDDPSQKASTGSTTPVEGSYMDQLLLMKAKHNIKKQVRESVLNRTVTKQLHSQMQSANKNNSNVNISFDGLPSPSTAEYRGKYTGQPPDFNINYIQQSNALHTDVGEVKHRNIADESEYASSDSVARGDAMTTGSTVSIATDCSASDILSTMSTYSSTPKYKDQSIQVEVRDWFPRSQWPLFDDTYPTCKEDLMNEVRLLLGALHKYKAEFQALDSSCSNVYMCFSFNMTEEDRLCSESVKNIRSEIYDEIYHLEVTLDQRLELIMADMCIDEFIVKNLAALQVVAQMIELLKEQFYHSNLVNNLQVYNEIFTESGQRSEVKEVTGQLAQFQKQLQMQQSQTTAVLSKSLRELRTSLMEEVRKNIQGETAEIKQKLQDTEENMQELKRKISQPSDNTAEVSQPENYAEVSHAQNGTDQLHNNQSPQQ